ncbi:SagB/ThcOx family dehydrogenase [Natrialbaceae archaeon AArc-T1-2]|uniref:SagB/ThcOx family dehydrogenase n=1 Tax=Natrialbaceae archaeon AArc-T1-2 TaxID=3053904 RepID=UPI00255B125C|nr:SagB/ThcOx family dehydrogenase [Natrialbaceae archaeon AArc-T1-2]WIV68028.1 SagB/ThcOx family dehydrogenase [Natrialbaceae archaeon AArc-T1-2]
MVDAREYHQRTKHAPRNVRGGGRLDFENKPTPYKQYAELSREELPDDPSGPTTPALEAITVDGPTPPGRDLFGDLEADELDRETLGELCHYAAGITKEIELENRTVEFRAASCTGALYHVDLYPVCGDLEDLEAGVYHYDPRTESLDVLRRGDYRGVLAAASEDDRVADAPVTFVATSTWWRNAWKYGERTFRHAFWDSGTILANLLAVAHSRGLPASVTLGFADDPVGSLLGLDPSDEAPLELVPVGVAESAPAEPDVDPIDPETDPLSPDPKTYSLIERAWRAGTLADGDRAEEWRRTARDAAPVGTRNPGDGDTVSLEPVSRETASSRPLANTIVRRGSCREYDREPISFRKLSTILDRAIRAAPLDVRDEDAPALSFVEPFLVVNGVDGLEAGTYHYHPDEAQLERLRRGECRQEAGHLALDQRLGADAAVCLYFLTDLEAVTDALGDRGYRLAQLEASLAAGRLYLATYAHRALGGTGLTFYDDVVTDFFEPRADGATPTFLYTIGRPAK